MLSQPCGYRIMRLPSVWRATTSSGWEDGSIIVGEYKQKKKKTLFSHSVIINKCIFILFSIRSCGKIFCADCSRNLVPLPAEQLYEPVRVCEPCFAVGAQRSINPLTSTTCKQAVADDQKRVNITLQPAPSN